MPLCAASGVCQGSGEPGSWGSSVADLPTTFAFTGQREAPEIGLYYYVARWYDSNIAHFTQADTVVPGAGNPIAYNRYAYTLYNPIKYVDPTGHYSHNTKLIDGEWVLVQSDDGVYYFSPPFKNLSASQEGLDFIAQFEGRRLEPYDDPSGHCTIGIGHLIHVGECTDSDFEEYLDFTEDDAFALFAEDIREFEEYVRQYVQVSLTQEQFDALVSFTYNLGAGALAESTLLELLNQGYYETVPYQMSRWVYGMNSSGEMVKLQGLINRRMAEGILFSLGIYIYE